MKGAIILAFALVAGAAGNSLYGAPTLVRLDSGSSSYGSSPSLVRASAPFIPITRYNQEIVGGVSDSHDFESANGIKVQETTRIVAGSGHMYEDDNGQMVKSDSAVFKSGSYSYTAADGTPIAVTWTADENGFHAAGAHLPTPPPIPADILASLPASSSSYYSAPALRVADYSAPAVRISDYSAPAVRVADYSAPAIRISNAGLY